MTGITDADPFILRCSTAPIRSPPGARLRSPSSSARRATAEVILDGDGAFRLFDVMGSAYNVFDGLTYSATPRWPSGRRAKDVAGATGLAVKHSRIENVGIGINAQYSGSKLSRHRGQRVHQREDRHRVLGWG